MDVSWISINGKIESIVTVLVETVATCSTWIVPFSFLKMSQPKVLEPEPATTGSKVCSILNQAKYGLLNVNWTRLLLFLLVPLRKRRAVFFLSQWYVWQCVCSLTARLTWSNTRSSSPCWHLKSIFRCNFGFGERPSGRLGQAKMPWRSGCSAPR